MARMAAYLEDARTSDRKITNQGLLAGFFNPDSHRIDVAEIEVGRSGSLLPISAVGLKEGVLKLARAPSPS